MKNKRFFRFLILLCCLGTTGYATMSKNSLRLYKDQLPASQPGFMENKGQVIGYDKHPHPEVKFVFQQGSTQLFLMQQGITYQFTRILYPAGYEELLKKQQGKENAERLQCLHRQYKFPMDI